MSIGLFDYNEQNPGAAELLDEIDIHETAQAMKDAQEAADRRERQAQATAQLKASILRQLEQGNAPELILYTALQAIGESTDDAAWTEAATGYLDTVYKDLMQQSLFVDSVTAATERLQEKRRIFAEKQRAEIKRELQALDTITAGLEMALYEYDYISAGMDPPTPEEGTPARNEWRKAIEEHRAERQRKRARQLLKD